MFASFAGTHAIVTAGTLGIGRGIVDQLLTSGSNVSVCARTSSGLQEIKERYPDRVYIEEVDLFDPQNTEAFAVRAVEHWGGKVNHLFYNAPHLPKGGISNLSVDDWQRAYAGIYVSMVSAIGAVLPAMVKANGGSIVIISSLSAVEPIAELALSSVLRGGLPAYVKLLARKYGQNNIRINAVLPGYTDTAIMRQSAQQVADDEGKSVDEILMRWAKPTALGRLGKPEEIANVALFLSSSYASYVTGSTVLVDGGYVQGV